MLPIELLFSFAVVQLPDSLREAAELDSPLTNVALMPLTVRFEADVDSASIISALQDAIVAEDADEHSISSFAQFIAPAEKDAALDRSISTSLPGKDSGPLIFIDAAEFASNSVMLGAVTKTVTPSLLFILASPVNFVVSLPFLT